MPVIHHEAINVAIGYIPEFLPVKALICTDYASKKGHINSSYILEETDDYFIVKDKKLLTSAIANHKHHYYSNDNYTHVISIGGVLYNYSNYIDSSHLLANNNLIYKVPIGKLDLPDTREQLQNTVFNKTYLGTHIKDCIDKFTSVKVQELKLLSIELESSSITDRILAYNDYAKNNGYSFRSLYMYIDANNLLELPEEYRFLVSNENSRYKSYYRSITTNVNASTITNNGSKFVSTTSKVCISFSDYNTSTLIIIDDLKKLPVSQMICLEQKFDRYFRINTESNSHIDFNKYIKFYNTFILPFVEDFVIIKASDLFTPELADKYKATKVPIVRTPSATGVSVKSNRSLACYRYLKLTGKERTGDFTYTALTQFEHNGSDVFDSSYSSLFKGVVIPFFSADVNLSSLNSFSTLALSYNVPVTYLRCNKTSDTNLLEDITKAFSDNPDVFVYDINKWEQGIEVLNFVQEGLVDTSNLSELASLYYIQSASDYRISYDLVKNIIKDNLEQYPLSNASMNALEAHYNSNNTTGREYSGTPFYQIVASVTKEIALHPTVLNILMPSFMRTGFIHCSEERLNNLINDYISSSTSNFFHLRINSIDNTIGKCISDKFKNNEESIND